jgi:hypothetical protein
MTLNDIDNFEKSEVWQEIKETIAEVIVGLVADLSTLDPVTQTCELARKQGRKAEAEFMLTLPGLIKADIKEDMERREGNGRGE